MQEVLLFGNIKYMDIIFHGQSFFEVFLKNAEGQPVRLVIDPFDEKLGLKMPKVSADIAFISHDHYDHANIKAIAGNPLVVNGLGEYEAKGVFAAGIPAFHDNVLGKERGRVVIYKIEAEDIKLCHLSDLGQKELTDEQVEDIGEVDVLFCPVGGKYTIDAKEAANIISQIEPRLVIPMHYKLPQLSVDLEGVEKFLKQMGKEDAVKEKKLKVSAKNLPAEETEIKVLEP